MKHLVDGVRHAIATESWYAALSLALTLPDTCAAFQNGRTGRRYVDWFDRYAAKYFADPTGRPYLTGAEFYKLRNSFLHEGGLRPQDAEPTHPDSSAAMFEVLNTVTLCVSDWNLVPSRNMVETSSGLQQQRRTSYSIAVTDLCSAICAAVEDWMVDARQQPGVTDAMDKMSRIVELDAAGRTSPL